jgi:hypothetical protein
MARHPGQSPPPSEEEEKLIQQQKVQGAIDTWALTEEVDCEEPVNAIIGLDSRTTPQHLEEKVAR